MGTSTPKTPSCQGQEWSQISQIGEAWFCIMTSVCTLIVVFSTIANGLVIYFAIKRPLTGPFRHLNTVVKHLAVSDLLSGLVTCPVTLVYFGLGKVQH